MSRAWGVFSTAEFLAHFEAVATDPAFDPTFAQLVDLRDVTAFNLDTGTLRAQAGASFFQPGVRRAIVAPSDIGFGLARMFGTYAQSASQTVAVFRAIDDAERSARPRRDRGASELHVSRTVDRAAADRLKGCDR